MTVISFGSGVSHFQGVSSDIRPDGVDEGATFHYVDTGEQYVYHNGMWELDLRPFTPSDSLIVL